MTSDKPTTGPRGGRTKRGTGGRSTPPTAPSRAPAERLLKLSEASLRVGVGEDTIRRAIALGEVPAFRLAAKSLRVTEAAIDAWAGQRERQAARRQELVGVVEAARRLHLSPRAIREKAKSGELPSERHAAAFLFNPEDLERWLVKQREPVRVDPERQA